jgi:basic membrane protein A
MNDSGRSPQFGKITLLVVLSLLLIFLVITMAHPSWLPSWLNIFPDTATTQPSRTESTSAMGEDGAATVATENRYYHRPVFVAAGESAQTGVNAAIWQGLCDYLGTTTQTDALCLCADTTESIYAAICQAERDVVPNVLIVTGENAAQAVEKAQTTYAGTCFVVLDGAVSSPASNTCCVSFACEQAGYLAGYAAVSEGYTRLLFAAEQKNEETQLYYSGYQQGIDRAAQNLNVDVALRSVWCDSQPQKEPTELITGGDAQVVFTCGSTEFQENAVSACAEKQRKILCSGSDFSYLYPDGKSGSPILASAVKDYGEVLQSILTQFDSGAWSQFYAGKSLRYDLSWGETVALTTAEGSWNFSHYMQSAYQQLLANMENDSSYAVSRTAPAPSSHLTLG